MGCCSGNGWTFDKYSISDIGWREASSQIRSFSRSIGGSGCVCMKKFFSIMAQATQQLSVVCTASSCDGLSPAMVTEIKNVAYRTEQMVRSDITRNFPSEEREMPAWPCKDEATKDILLHVTQNGGASRVGAPPPQSVVASVEDISTFASWC